MPDLASRPERLHWVVVRVRSLVPVDGSARQLTPRRGRLAFTRSHRERGAQHLGRGDSAKSVSVGLAISSGETYPRAVGRPVDAASAEGVHRVRGTA
ncbi:hypothetical protein GCM10018954_037630 [Kutzneria kofuensis]